MPVLVTGDGGFVARAAVRALSEVSPQVRVYVGDPAEVDELRALGAKVATGSLEDAERLETVMTGVHTVCHLSVMPGAAEPEVAGIVQIARRAGVRRLLVLAQPPPDPAASRDWLGEHIDPVDLEHVVILTEPLYGPDAPWLRALAQLAGRRRPRLPVDPSTVLRPVDVRDAAAVLAAADDRERVVSGIWRLEGPDEVTVASLAELLARGLPGRSRRAWGRGSAGATGLDILLGARPSEDLPDAAAEFGVRRAPLAEGLARSLAGGAEGVAR